MNIDEYKSELDYLINNYKQKIHHSRFFTDPKVLESLCFLITFSKNLR